MSEPTTAVELHGLRKSFSGRGGEVVAVDGVDLSIGSGEVVALLGPNGAGKTTTLDMVLGMTDPSAGTARVFGRSPRQAVTDGRVSAVLQTGGLLADLTVHETLRYLASTFPGLPAERVGDVVERAGLTELTRRRVSKCSGGEQQRLRFAIALLAEPALLVLDEPTAGMDVAARRDFWAVMRAEAAQGRTVVFATHYLEEADDFADRIVLMARGRVVMDGTTEQVRERATGRVVAADVPDVGVAAHRLGALGEVRSTGARVSVRAADSDEVARVLLVELGGHDLEVSTGSLEDAFVALTSATPDSATTHSATTDSAPTGHAREDLR